MKRVEISDYSLVKHLEFEHATAQLSKYKNVRKVLCSGLLNLVPARIIELANLKHIEELHLFNHHTGLNDKPSDRINANLANTFNFLTNSIEFQDIDLRPGFRIYVQGLQYDETLQRAPNYQPSFLHAHFENREILIAPYHQFTNASFNEDFKQFLKERPQLLPELKTGTFFHHHYPYIEIINIYQKVPADQVLLFLGNFRRINVLTIRHPGFKEPQEFYNELATLPGLAASLNEFYLFEDRDSEIYDYAFLFKFKRLHKIHSNVLPPQPALDLIGSLSCPAYADLTLKMLDAGKYAIDVQKFRTAKGEIQYDLQTSQIILHYERKAEVKYSEKVNNISFEIMSKHLFAEGE